MDISCKSLTVSVIAKVIEKTYTWLQKLMRGKKKQNQSWHVPVRTEFDL